MKRGIKVYLLFLASITFLSLLFLFSYNVLMSTTPVDTHTEYAYVPNGRSDNLSVINTTTNEIEYSFDIGDDPEGVAISPDGTRVYVTNSNIDNVSIIDTSTNRVIYRVPVGNNPIGIAVTQDGKTVYVANFYSNDVSIIDTTTKEAKYRLDVETNPVGVAINKDGTKVYVANQGSGTVSVIDATICSVLESVYVGPSPYGVAVTPDGNKVYITHSNSNKISVIETTQQNVSVETIDIGSATERVELSPLGVAVSPDGKKVYVANHKKRIKGISDTPRGIVSVINTTTNDVVANITVDKCPCGISVNKDGTKVYVANSESDTVSVIYVENNNTVEYIPVGDMPSALGQFIGSPPEVPEHNAIREFSHSIVESINRTYIKFNSVINGVQGFFLGIISTIFYGVLSGLIVPKITKKLDPKFIRILDNVKTKFKKS